MLRRIMQRRFFDEVRGEDTVRQLTVTPVVQDLSARYLALGARESFHQPLLMPK